MATQKTEIPTKNIINIGLLIAGFLVVKKVLETIGVLKTSEEKKEEEQSIALETGSTTTSIVIDKNKPELALNPNYWKAILTDINKKRIAKKLPKLTSDNIAKLLTNDLGIKTNYVYQADNIWNQIVASKGVFDDNETRLYNAIQKIRSQLILSFIVYRVSTRFNIDFWNFIKSFTNETEQSKIYNIIKSKPLI